MGNGKWLSPALLLELWSSNTSSELCQPHRLGFPYLGTWGTSGSSRHSSHPTNRPRPMHARCPNLFFFWCSWLLLPFPQFLCFPSLAAPLLFNALLVIFCSPSPRGARQGQVAAVPGQVATQRPQPSGGTSTACQGWARPLGPRESPATGTQRPDDLG